MIKNKNTKYDINYLTQKDVEDNEVTLEYVQRMSPYLNKNSPELYKLFLSLRPDLGDIVKEHYLNIIKKLEEDEMKEIDEALLVYKDIQEYKEE